MGARRSIPAQVMAERRFPVRVRVYVPPQGFGQQLNEIHGWLHRRYGTGGYFVGAIAGAGIRDAMAIYLPDAIGASELVAAFNLSGLVEKVG